MDIVVCVKRVAATDTAIKIGADGTSIDPEGVEFVLNPYDEFAVEQALLLKEQAGSGSVTVITYGPKDAQKELRSCLAMGADKAVVIEADGWVFDSLQAASAVAAEIRKNPCDLVFVGKQAVDSDNNQFGPRLARMLDMGSVTEVNKLEFEGGTLTAERNIEGAREVVTCKTPAVVSCEKGLNSPRSANLKGIMAAKKKPLETVAAEGDLPVGFKAVSLTLPPPRAEGRILGEGAAAVPALIEALKNEAKVL